MSYRNPEIITDKSGEIITQGFASFGQSVAGGLQQWSANIEKRKKEQEEKDQRQLQIKTTGQLNALKRSTDFNSKLPATTLTEEIKPIIRERLMYSADLSSELYSETDPQRRQELMKEISNVERFLDTTAAGLGKLNEDVSAYAELSPTELNAQYGIAGDKNAQVNNQGFLAGLAGQADNANFKPYFDEKTNSIVVRAGGNIGGSDFYMEDFNFSSYVSGSDLIFPISQLRKEAADSASKLILDEKGNMKPGLVNEKQLQVITQDVIQNGKVTGKRKVQGQIETVNINAIKQTINPLVNAEIDSLLDSSDQQKEAILNNQYGGLSWEEFANIKDPIKQKEALRSVIEPVIVTDVLGNDFKQGNIGGETMYYRETEKMQEVKPAGTTTTKEGAAQMKIYDKAKNLTDDLLRANSKKNQDYFVGKTIKGGKEIQSAKWEGDNLILTTIDTSGSNSFEEETVYNMNRRERVETMVADFVKENYGKDASSEDIRDMATKILRERQASRQSKINTSYK